MAFNRLGLIAQIIEIKPIRYTPAGLPCVDLRLAHESEQEENAKMRVVKLNLSACVIGVSANMLTPDLQGKCIKAKGFLANKSLKYHQPIFHITEFDITDF